MLRNLFPNGQYSFQDTATVAIASFSLESLRNMAWLGGGGYDLLALYIHDICYKEANGRIRNGIYCPVMFENLADPILTGREELGVPKLFSDISISKNESSGLVKVSWRGAQWAELEWKDMQKDENASNGAPGIGTSEGLLVHKYIPSTGGGKPDADYDILILNDPASSSIRSRYTAAAANVRLEIKDLGAKALPTLQPVIGRLAELPIYEIMGGTLTEYQGVSDLSNLERLN